MEIKIDLSSALEFELQLTRFREKALPFATRNTLNTVGFAVRRIAIERIQDEFITRNKFTTRSIRVEQTRSLIISDQRTIVGSTADYMEVQEFGGTKSKKGKKGTPIPTSYSARLPQNTIPRTKLPTRGNKLQNIRLTKGRSGKRQSTKQRNHVTILLAAREGRKFIFLDLGQTQGIFKVIGGKKKPKIKMIYDLSNQSVRIPRHPWLAPSIDDVLPLIPDIYIKSLEFQINRFKLFRDK